MAVTIHDDPANLFHSLDSGSGIFFDLAMQAKPSIISSLMRGMADKSIQSNKWCIAVSLRAIARRASPHLLNEIFMNHPNLPHLLNAAFGFEIYSWTWEAVAETIAQFCLKVESFREPMGRALEESFSYVESGYDTGPSVLTGIEMIGWLLFNEDNFRNDDRDALGVIGVVGNGNKRFMEKLLSSEAVCKNGCVDGLVSKIINKLPSPSSSSTYSLSVGVKDVSFRGLKEYPSPPTTCPALVCSKVLSFVLTSTFNSYDPFNMIFFLPTEALALCSLVSSIDGFGDAMIKALGGPATTAIVVAKFASQHKRDHRIQGRIASIVKQENDLEQQLLDLGYGLPSHPHSLLLPLSSPLPSQTFPVFQQSSTATSKTNKQSKASQPRSAICMPPPSEAIVSPPTDSGWACLCEIAQTRLLQPRLSPHEKGVLEEHEATVDEWILRMIESICKVNDDVMMAMRRLVQDNAAVADSEEQEENEAAGILFWTEIGKRSSRRETREAAMEVEEIILGEEKDHLRSRHYC